MSEREVKVLVDSDARLPSVDVLLHGIAIATAEEEIDQEAVYFDTPDLRLTRAGASLRYRSDDGWTVKLPESRHSSTFVRGEYAFVGGAGVPPEPAVDLVRALVRSAPLGEVARLRTRRHKIRVADEHGRPIGEIDDDSVVVLAPTSRRERSFREVEIELDERAGLEAADRIARRLRSHARGGAARPKVKRALGGRGDAPPDVVPPKKVSGHARTAEVVRAALASSVSRLVEHDPVVRSGDDPEGVHQARVATRRLRSDLRTFRRVLDPEWSEALRSELQWLGEGLGRVRDADVLLEELRTRVDDLTPAQQESAGALLDRLGEARRRDREALLDIMRGARYLALLDALVDAAAAPRFRKRRGKVAGRRAAQRVTRRPWKRLRKAVDGLAAHPSNSDLHEVRKRAKQARYAYEAVAPVTGRPVRRTAKALAELQGVLGDLQDTVVASEWLEHAANDTERSDTVFCAGLLAGDFAASRRRLRESWLSAWHRARRRHRQL
jgi:CHAD domain-containing protein